MPAQAQAQHLSAANFFDFDYARGLWNTIRTRTQLEAFYAANCPDGGTYDLWMAEYKRDPQKALEDLKTDPHAEEIKHCYDLVLTNRTWMKMYDTWRTPLEVYGGKGWNKDVGFFTCPTIRSMNIFTGKCTDLPDWRSPKGVKQDAAAMAIGNARWSKNSGAN